SVTVNSFRFSAAAPAGPTDGPAQRAACPLPCSPHTPPRSCTARTPENTRRRLRSVAAVQRRSFVRSFRFEDSQHLLQTRPRDAVALVPGAECDKLLFDGVPCLACGVRVNVAVAVLDKRRSRVCEC